MNRRLAFGLIMVALLAGGILLVALSGTAYSATYSGGDTDGRTASITMNSNSIVATGNTSETEDGEVEVWIEVSYNGTDFY